VAADEPYGIWGGLGPDGRRSLRRRLLHKNTATALADDAATTSADSVTA
jgi:hypothetical protein